MIRQIRVLIADDHPVVRHGLRNMLKSVSGIVIVGEADTGQKTLEEAWLATPDVIVLDLRMPGLTGLQVVEALRKCQPSVKIIILTGYAEDEYIRAAFEVGAHAFLSKNTGHQTLEETIRRVCAGDRILNCGSAGSVNQRLMERQTSSGISKQPYGPLTNREVEIVRLIAVGHTNKEIAEEFRLSVETIKKEVTAILIKLNVCSRAQAVAKAVRRGII